MADLLRKLALALFGDYSIFFIYSLSGGTQPTDGAEPDTTFDFREVDQRVASASSDPSIQSQLQYFGSEAFAFACLKEARIIGLCIYWVGDRYRQRNFWPLADDEAKLVQIVTLPEMRGQGVAAMLIRRSSQAMAGRGFKTLYARIWHSNKPSWRAFARAGWKRVALAVELHPLPRRRRLRVYLGRQPRGRRSDR